MEDIILGDGIYGLDAVIPIYGMEWVHNREPEQSRVTGQFDINTCIVVGRYNKYSRTLSQTPWIIDGARKTESSIEELVCTKIQAVFRADGKN